MNATSRPGAREFGNVTALSSHRVAGSPRTAIDYSSAEEVLPEAHFQLRDQTKPEMRSRRPWVLPLWARWLNDLCRAKDDHLPRLTDISADEFDKLQDVFAQAFKILRDDLEDFDVKSFGPLGEYELRVRRTVTRKTLGYGKLAEKLPRRVFLLGEARTETHRGLSPCGVDNQHLDEAVRGAIATGWLGRHVGAPDDAGNVSHVYLPLPAECLVHHLFERVRACAHSGGREIRNAVEVYRQETLRLTASVLVVPRGASPQPVIVKGEAISWRASYKQSRREEQMEKCDSQSLSVPIRIRKRTRTTLSASE